MTLICNFNSKNTALNAAVVVAIFSLVVSVVLASCSTLSERPPDVTLQIPSTFNHDVNTRKLDTGDVILDSPPDIIKANAPMTTISGRFGPAEKDTEFNHLWSVEVSAKRSLNVINAYSNAKDGYEANLDNVPYMFARFARETFSWGKAVSYLSQSTQDNSLYVPNNGHLTYEIWGFSQNERYTVHAIFAVSHPKLSAWPDTRSVENIDALKRDADYQLVEKCDSNEFNPGLQEINAMLNSLRIR